MAAMREPGFTGTPLYFVSYKTLAQGNALGTRAKKRRYERNVLIRSFQVMANLVSAQHPKPSPVQPTCLKSLAARFRPRGRCFLVGCAIRRSTPAYHLSL